MVGETATGGANDQGVTYLQVQPGCPYCAAQHAGTCPRVEEMEYYPDGALKRVKLREVQDIEVTTTYDVVGKESNMTFDELGKLPQSERDEMLIQAIAIISVQPRFGDKTPHEIFDIVAEQAAEIKAMG